MDAIPSNMRRLIATTFLAAIATAAFSQGWINCANTMTTLMLTNSQAIGGNGSGAAVSAGGPYYYEVLTAPSTVTSVDASLQQLLSGPWSDTGLEATNTGLAGRLNTVNETVNNWPPWTTNSFIIVGWSSGEGSTWAQVAASLQGASLVAANGGFMWVGGTLVGGGFLGATTVSFGEAVGVTTLPNFNLFGNGNSSQGNPITTPTTLWVVNVPEPSIFALAGLGTAALLIFRRRK